MDVLIALDEADNAMQLLGALKENVVLNGVLANISDLGMRSESRDVFVAFTYLTPSDVLNYIRHQAEENRIMKNSYLVIDRITYR